MVGETIHKTIGFIGAGKVGISLGSYFRQRGLTIAGYFSRTPDSAVSAAKITNTTAFDTIGDLARSSDILFITTPDDQIVSVWKALSHEPIEGKFICHTSGSLSSELFFGVRECGAFGFSIHPMFSFAQKDGETHGLETAYFTVEGDERCLCDIRDLFARIGNQTLVIESQNKALYHLANATVSNLVLSLISIGCEFLEMCGISHAQAASSLWPLMNGNMQNIGLKGYLAAMTGPVERNDIGTVKEHLAVAVLPKGYEHLYRDLSLRLVDLAKAKHPQRDYAELEALLRKT